MLNYIENDAELQLQTEEEQTTMASDQHGELGALIIAALVNFVYARKLGRVFNAQTSFNLLPGQPAQMPDAAFVRHEKLPTWLDDNVPFAPDLAVEVVSRRDDWSEVVLKANNYLEAGTQLVWVVDPYAKNVFVFRPGNHVVMLTPQDELTGEELLPGFSFKISNLFDPTSPPEAGINSNGKH